MTTPSSVCVYPLSPTYEPLHRYLYYTSLVLSILYPTPPPLIKGAFAYSLTYSSTAALYAILILAIPLPTITTAAAAAAAGPQTQQRLTTLDIPALWAILSPASILLLPLLTWSTSLRPSARPIIRIWGLLILIGASCTLVSLLRSLPAPASTMVTNPDCSALAALASAQKLKLRDPNHVLSASSSRLFGSLYGLVARLAPLTLTPLAFGAFSCIVTVAQSPSSPAPAESWNGIEVSSATTPSSPNLSTALRSLFLSLRRLVLHLTALFLLPVLVTNEMYLLQDAGLPQAEQMYEVGQWGLLAGLGLVSAAAGVNWVAGGGRGESGGGMKGEEVCVV